MLELLEVSVYSLGGYINISVSAVEGIVSGFVMGDKYPKGGAYRMLGKKSSQRWLDKFEELHIEKWQSEYTPLELECDGENWSVNYKREGKRCRHIRGSSAYPKDWESFIELIDEIIPLINPARLERVELQYSRNSKAVSSPGSYTEQLVIDRKSGTLIYRQSAGTDVTVTKEFRKKNAVVELIEDIGIYFELFDRSDGTCKCDDKAEIKITIICKRLPEETFSRSYNRYGLPDDWNVFLGKVYKFICRFGFVGELFDADVFARGVKDNEYIYYSVEFEDGIKTYYYRSQDDTLKIGDRVLVPMGAGDTPRVAEIVDFEYFTEDCVPLPAESTKSIIRKIGKDENLKFRCPLCNRDIDINECLEASESARSICISEGLPEWAAKELIKKRDTCLACGNMPTVDKT